MCEELKTEAPQEQMLNRAVLIAKRAEYERAQNQAVASANFYAGAMATIDDLVALLDQQAAALASQDKKE